MHRRKFLSLCPPVTGTPRQEKKKLRASELTYHFILLFYVTVVLGGDYNWVRASYECVLGDGVANVPNGDLRRKCIAMVYHRFSR